jgi:hypothetical protein
MNGIAQTSLKNPLKLGHVICGKTWRPQTIWPLLSGR